MRAGRNCKRALRFIGYAMAITYLCLGVGLLSILDDSKKGGYR